MREPDESREWRVGLGWVVGVRRKGLEFVVVLCKLLHLMAINNTVYSLSLFSMYIFTN